MIDESDESGIFDVATVGGGIVGLATALGLAVAGYRVAVIERRRPERSRGRLGCDIRTVALSSASVDWLGELCGAEASGLGAIETMRVWEHDGAGLLRFSAPNGCEALAWVAENSALVSELWQAAQGRVTFIVPAGVTALVTSSDDIELVCRREDQSESEPAELRLRAQLVVAADGADSRVRELAGGEVRRQQTFHGEPQCAVATIARTRQPHRRTAWQRFGATGPVALLPLADEHTTAVIWSVAESVGKRLRDLDDDAFKRALTCETEEAGGGIEAVDRRVFLPLQQTLAKDLNPLPRVVLAGDAARALHPLAGQGVNIGLEDARAIVADLNTDRGDAGATNRWRDYAVRRRRRSKFMLALMNGLLAAYCGRAAGNPWMRLARNTATRCIDASAAAKAQLVREAFGLGPLASW